MHLAILGATSQIAKDTILSLSRTNWDLSLFARRPEAVALWLSSAGEPNRYPVHDLDRFGTDIVFDAILNFIGVGDPAKTALLGSQIFEITLSYDGKVVDYLNHHRNCRYLFLSSGAIFGTHLNKPVDDASIATVAINDLGTQDWYGLAKLCAECRHRSLTHLSITDLRVFGYVGPHMDVSMRFFIADIIRSLQTGNLLITSPRNFVRDYIGVSDFTQLIFCILRSPATNSAIDCYTKAPVDKFSLLQKMTETFGLSYEVRDDAKTVDATGIKLNYFSRSRRAEKFGYLPQKDSLQTVSEVIRSKIADCA